MIRAGLLLIWLCTLCACAGPRKLPFDLDEQLSTYDQADRPLHEPWRPTS